MGRFYAAEEGEMYSSCLLYRRIHLISAPWTSAFPITKVHDTGSGYGILKRRFVVTRTITWVSYI
jgi:hypothetical protein